MKKRGKTFWIILTIIVVALTLFIYIKFYFVFGVGVKTGELNYVVKKGYIFKTHEGKIIQAGFQTEDNTGIHSNEFIFSIQDDALAEEIMHNYEGKVVSLQYKEYLGKLPWRGNSKYIVDSVVSVKDAPPSGRGVPIIQ